MGDKGSKDKGNKEDKKKAKLGLKEKRKLKNKRRRTRNLGFHWTLLQWASFKSQPTHVL